MAAREIVMITGPASQRPAQTAFTIAIESKDLDFGDPLALKFIQRVFIDFDRVAGDKPFTVKILARKSESDSHRVLYEGTFTPSLLRVVTSTEAEKLIRIRIEDTSPTDQWVLTRLRIEGGTAGKLL